MESLATNDEQVIRSEAAQERPVEELEDAVVERRDFFQEADEVREALRRATCPDLEAKACRGLCERVGEVWSQYQEQPGLLDPFLEELVDPLINAIRRAVHEDPRRPASALPNLHMLSSLLYVLTTVRGYKTVSRFFPHEACDLEPCLEAAEAEAAAASTETWSTLYCLTLWLGMVLLTPFDLRSIDSGGCKRLATRVLELGQQGLTSTSRTRDASAWMLAKYFMRPDVSAEGASVAFYDWTKSVWSPPADGTGAAAPATSQPTDEAKSPVEAEVPVAAQSSTSLQEFARCGSLQAWNQILKAAPRSALDSVWLRVLELALQGPSCQAGADFGGSSLLRKLRVKVACRATLVALPPRVAPWRYERGARSLLVNFAQATAAAADGAGAAATAGGASRTGDDAASAAAFAAAGGIACAASTAVDPSRDFVPPARAGASGSGQACDEACAEEDDDDVPEQVEDLVDLLLKSLADADTVVRWAAAKGVGRVTNRLSRDFGDQVLESLLERCFSFRETDRGWHGGCLGLAELTRRGLLLPERLPTVVPLVCQALHYEQASGNYVVGQHVRDAACYVCWAFARAYAPDVLEPFVGQLATALIQVALYDREINCRRAAAAAVQEHVGRQGTFPNGIEVVTLADYWTLSARRNAYLVVAPQLAALGSYRQSLIDHLVDRKLQHHDVQIRVLTGQALARLYEDPSEATTQHLNTAVLPRLLARATDSSAGGAAPAAATSAGTATAAGAVHVRHGAVVGVAALVAAAHAGVTVENQTAVRNLVPSLEKMRAYRGRGGEVVRQASCALLARVAAATEWPFKDATCARYLQTIDECARHATDTIRVAAADALRELARIRFKPELCNKCVDTYIAGLQNASETLFARRGYVLCLAALPPSAHLAHRSDLLAALDREVRGDGLPGGKEIEDPQTRQYAVLALGRMCFGGATGLDGDGGVGGVAGHEEVAEAQTTLTGPESDLVVAALEAAMADYAVDRRGDVGSWVREVAMEVIAAILIAQRCGGRAGPTLQGTGVTTRLLGLLLQQAVEKIDRLRERAAALLRHVSCGHATAGGAAALVELAYQRVCHGASYDLAALAPAADAPEKTGEATAPSSSAWPPAHLDALVAALQQAPAPVVGVDRGNAEAGAAATVFDAVTPLLDFEAYRSNIALGIVISVGGITESTANEGRRALLAHLRAGAGDAATSGGVEDGRQAKELCEELLRIFDRVGTKDSDSEAKRVLWPLLRTIGLLLADSLVPASLAPPLFDRARRAVGSSRDIARLRAAIPVFVGLLRWPGAVRRNSMSMLLQLLGFSYPTVRQAAAQALYIRLIEEEGDLDLSGGDEATAEALVPAADVAGVMELVSATPWGTDNEEALAEALRTVYAKFGMSLPSGGRSILAPKRPRESQKPKTAEYADLVRENHY